MDTWFHYTKLVAYPEHLVHMPYVVVDFAHETQPNKLEPLSTNNYKGAYIRVHNYKGAFLFSKKYRSKYRTQYY